jgi:hypothetical protein
MKGESISGKMEVVAAMIGRNQDLVDILDEVLSGPDDRAYILCSTVACSNNIKGQCTIHTVQGLREILGNGRSGDSAV